MVRLKIEVRLATQRRVQTPQEIRNQQHIVRPSEFTTTGTEPCTYCGNFHPPGCELRAQTPDDNLHETIP